MPFKNLILGFLGESKENLLENFSKDFKFLINGLAFF
tara:strand:- start:334 stop:444 length:111 start_codon:yes stop_codon:yes gene_type:complete